MTAHPLRIAMTSYYLPSESKIGAGYMAHRLANVMQARGHQVTMFSPCVKPDDAVYSHVHTPITGSLRTFRWAKVLRKLNLTGFDLVHAHGDNHLRMPWRKPYVVRTMHGSCFAEALRICGAKERLRMVLLGFTELLGALTARKTIAVSRATTRSYPWIRTVIPNGVDLDRFHPGTKEDAPTILFVGTYHQRKRGKLLMEVFAHEVQPKVPSAQLWMVCNDAPPAPGVTVLGKLTDEDLADRYRRAWVFCLPSTYEGFGVPYIEAMASGTAVVASPNPGAKEVLRDGAGAVVTDKTLGSTIVQLLTESKSRAELEEGALQAAPRYSWNRVAEEYEAVYQRVLDRRPPL